MHNRDCYSVAPRTEQKYQETFQQSNPIPKEKNVVSLFTWNTMLLGINDELTEKEVDILQQVFDESADKEDLYGELFDTDKDIPDSILNEKEQKNLLQLLRENYPKIFNVVNDFVKNLQSKPDEEKIADNLYLKRKDARMLHMNGQIIGYSLRDLNIDNLLNVLKEYKGISLLYDIYVDATLRSEEVLNCDLESFLDNCFKAGEKRTDEKIKEYTLNYEKLKNEHLKAKGSGIKDLEMLKEKCREFANHLLKIGRENNIYIKDYEKVLEEAIDNNDLRKLVVATQRLADRIMISTDKEKKLNASKRAIEMKEPNGEIDENFVQGYTGDCWFLSPLKAMCKDKDILKKINDMITVNKENDVIKSVTVNLHGKDYTIDYDNLKGANEYATGDLDVRALEMALNQYMQENNLGEGDIDLGWKEKDAYIFLFGEDNVEVTEYTVNGNFWEFDSKNYLDTLIKNKDNKIISSLAIFTYNYAIDKEENIFAEDTDGKPVELHYEHAYDYTGIDKKYLYFTDPQAPEKELRIPHKRVGEIFDGACTVKFK